MEQHQGQQTGIILTTALATFIGGFFLGVWTIRGYLIDPKLVAERRGNYRDPVESDESDVDESDTLLDHAPSWSNGVQADRRQGLSFAAGPPAAALQHSNEECKLVLVVRTDLGMTKGTHLRPWESESFLVCFAKKRQNTDSN